MHSGCLDEGKGAGMVRGRYDCRMRLVMRSAGFIGPAWRAPFVLLAAVLAVVACGRGAESPDAQEAGGPRIVSLSPAISRTLVDFGLQELIVGRTPYCESLDESVPTVGDLLNVNYEHLIRLDPTHILVQPPAAGIDAQLQKMASARNWKLHSWRLDGISDVKALVQELPDAVFDRDTPRHGEAERRAQQLLSAIESSLSPDPSAFTRPVLIVSAVDPVLAAGKGTYLDDILTAIGGVNATHARGWVSLSIEDVIRLAPEGLVIVTSARVSHVQAAGPLFELNMPAAVNRRIGVLRDPDAMLPSSAVAKIAGDVRTILREFAENPR